MMLQTEGLHPVKFFVCISCNIIAVSYTHLALDGFSEQEFKGSTPDEYMASMYYYNSLKLLRKAAQILEKAEYTEYLELEEHQKQCLLDEYFSPKGHLTVNTQTAYVLAVNFEVYRDYDILVADFEMCIRDRI